MVSVTTNSNVSQRTENNKYVFDFGTIKKGYKTVVEVLLKAPNITEISTESTCGCTVAKPEKVNDGLYSIEVTYKNSSIVNPFSKVVTVNFKSNGVKQSVKLNLKGVIID